MSVNFKSNFNLVTFLIADFPPIGINQVLYCQYVEDIQSATTLMDIQVTDSETGFLSELGGMENVLIVIDDSEGKTQLGGDFVIYDIQDRKNVGGKSSAVLRMCRTDFLNNAANKVSRRFGKGMGQKIHNIVRKEILEDLMGVDSARLDDFEPTKNNFSFVSPYWNPFTAIRWLAARSIPASSGSGLNATSGYAFYETRSGYHFVSYDSFSQKEPVVRIVAGHETLELEESDDLGIISVDRVNVESTANLLQGLNIGSYSSNLMTIDVSTMEFIEHPFNINKYYQNVSLMNSNATPEFYKEFKNDLTYTRIMSKVTDSALFTSGTYTDGYTKQISQSALREKLFYNKKCTLEIISDYSLEIGEVVQLDIYKGGRDRLQDFVNSGRYVIGKVERTYKSSEDRMSTKLTLFTDSDGEES
tara:strand:+ start:1211 stop:2461 length:1251 start_codon:yes stop_codon:yes gene_type:complete